MINQERNKNMENITAERAIELVRATIKGKEEYVDPISAGRSHMSCQYTPEEGKYTGTDSQHESLYIDYPGCLIGQICLTLGAELEQLRVMDSYGTVPSVIEECAFPFDIDPDAAHVFFEAQKAQDSGNTWGVALAHAEVEYARIEAV